MTLLATKTELNSAKTELQTGIATAASKADSAQATANGNAQTISTHTTQISALNTGLSAKVSQTDFNTLSGRVTTAENNITAKANELSSKITSVEGKIPTSVGGRNLIIRSQIQNGYIDNTGNFVNSNGYFTTGFIVATNNKQFTITAPKNDGELLALFRLIKYDAGKNFLGRDIISYTQNAKTVKVINLADNVAYFKVSFDGLYGELFKIERGSLPTDWSPAPEDYDSKLAAAQSEIKQTTDAITASVSSVQTAASNAQSTANTAVSKADAAQAGVNTLDSTTVKSASLTINTDGIVMKAGKSTTDVANAIGSYFSVNQNAINLFSDKINVKGSMIVDGAITSTKIAAGAITADKIQAGSITADMFKGNQITSLNGATTLNLYTGEIIFNNQYATINQIKGSYKSQISLSSVDYKAVNESAWSSVNMLAFNSTKLTSATRRAGSAVDMFSKFSLMTLYGEKIAFTGETSGIPNSQNAIIVNTNSDDVNFTNSQTNSSEGAWNYSMIMDFGANAAISAPDIKLAGHFKSLTGILDDLCKKVGVMWI